MLMLSRRARTDRRRRFWTNAHLQSRDWTQWSRRFLPVLCTEEHTEHYRVCHKLNNKPEHININVISACYCTKEQPNPTEGMIRPTLSICWPSSGEVIWSPVHCPCSISPGTLRWTTLHMTDNYMHLACQPYKLSSPLLVKVNRRGQIQQGHTTGSAWKLLAWGLARAPAFT